MHKNYLSEAYRMATEKRFGYLFLDMTPGISDERYRVRSDIFNPNESLVFLPK